MTEEEAKTKWCPFARTVEQHVGGDDSQVCNRVVVVDADHTKVGEVIKGLLMASELVGANCIAAACMAWRVLSEGQDRSEVKELRKPHGEVNPPFSNCPEGFLVASHNSAGFYLAERKVVTGPAQGYCGLAGRP